MKRGLYRAFTLLEIVIAMVIAMMVIAMAIPSLSGLLESRKEEAGFEVFNGLVQTARIRAMEERQPWVLEWQKDVVVLRAALPTEEGEEESESFVIPEEASLLVAFPDALVEKPRPVWTFWPSGNCEAAVITYREGKSAGWVARYHPLTVRAEVERL